MLISSCEDNLNTPVIHPEMKANSKVLVELFSSITCVNCIQASIYCDNISFLKGVSVNDTNVLVINYHPSFFPADPFYQFNKSLNKAREDYYNINFIPSGYADGRALTSPFSAEQWTNSINAKLAYYKKINLQLENLSDTSNRSGKIIIKANLVMQDTNRNLKLFAIITEGNLYVNAPNGKNNYFNIARQMLTQHEGEDIYFEPGQPVIFIKNYTVLEGIIFSNSQIIVFIQNYESKEILAVESVKFLKVK